MAKPKRTDPTLVPSAPEGTPTPAEAMAKAGVHVVSESIEDVVTFLHVGGDTKVEASVESSMAARCDPTPMAMPAAWAAAARWRLMARSSVFPPVMLEMRMGALSLFPRKTVDVSTWSRSSSGSAWWMNRTPSSPLPRRRNCTSFSRLIRT